MRRAGKKKRSARKASAGKSASPQRSSGPAPEAARGRQATQRRRPSGGVSQASPPRRATAAALLAPAAFTLYLLGREVYFMLSAGQIFLETLVAYFWYLVAIGIAVYAAVSLLRGRHPSRTLWRWLIALSVPSAGLFGYVLWYELARRGSTSASAVTQLALAVASFVCFAAVGVWRLSVWSRHDQGAPGRGRRRVMGGGSDRSPGSPLY